MNFMSSSSLKAILGPTNTGKTHFAIDRMLAYPTGMIGLPLRLLAREVYQRVAARVGNEHVALITGEERVVPARARYWVCTVEAMPTDMPVECLAIDEIQTAISFERGHVFTDRILNARGLQETLLLGAATMVPAIRALLPGAEIISRPRLSELTYAGSRKISRQPRRTAIVAFSAHQVYAIAELLRRERGGAAVVMGALSPRTRNAQVELYQSGDVDFLVATDAIGMGLNLDVEHVAFADDTKFDGQQTRPLTPAEFGQIAGRAGRHLTNGTFGVTGNADEFDIDLVQRLEGHDFEPVKVLQWRNPDLDFTSIAALQASLDAAPTHKVLTRVPVATDQHALEFLARNEAGRLATTPEAVRLLWECCSIPDYRDISPAHHGEIVTQLYVDLRRHGRIDQDWIAEQVRFCDNINGDIDTLSNRIRQIRTWTFVANRKNWLEDPAHWREKTRDIEDRLSDALHERLTQRFVDRRTSVLLRHLRDKRMVVPEINAQGEVSLEGHLIGRIEGFRFTLARSEEGDAKGLRAAAGQVIAPEIHNRAERLAGAPNEEFVLATDGYLRWKGEIVANLAEGDSLYQPRLILLADESLTGADLDAVQDRLNLWLRHHINTQLEPIMALSEPADLEGPARGVAYRLYEHLGLLARPVVADEVKGLDQDVRGKMRKHGIKFGAYHIYVPASLKPAPRELAILLYALKHGGIRQPGVSELPQIVLSGRTSVILDPEIRHELYEIAGFKVAGKRAVRIDILERLADLIRPLVAIDAATTAEAPPGAAEGNGFRVTVEMTSLLGCSGEDFASILTSLGYRVRRTPKPPAPPAEAPAPEPADTSEAETAPVERGPVDTAAAVSTDSEALAAVEGAAPSVSAEEASFTAAAEDPGQGVLPSTAETDTLAAASAPEPDGSAPAEPVEDASGPLPEAGAAVPEAAMAEAEAAGPEAQAEAAEPEYDEVWFPGGRRHDTRRPRHHNERRQGARDGAEGEPVQARGHRPPRPRHNGAEPAPADGASEGKPQGDGNGRNGDGNGRKFGKPRYDGKPRFDRPRRAREPAYDPDSPFAALAALRDRKPE
jgi:ATP-dependent RNA helicase SUPV3L1/SUV3